MTQANLNLNAQTISDLGVTSGAQKYLALDGSHALLASLSHGSKYQFARQNKLFRGANAAGRTMSNALATTYVGLCLSNPAASGKNIEVRRASGLFVVAPAGVAAFNLITGFAAGGITAHTTPGTIQSGIVGGTSVSVAKLDEACTLVGTPAWSMPLGVNGASTNPVGFNIDLEGAFIIPPGGYLAIGSVGAAGPTSGFFGSFEWVEFATPSAT